MNIRKVKEAIVSSKLDKKTIAERCGVSRTTIDNLLSGADVKISTIEKLADVLSVPAGSFFDYSDDTLSNKVEGCNFTSASAKIVVEIDLDPDEIIRLGLKDKVVQILKIK